MLQTKSSGIKNNLMDTIDKKKQFNFLFQIEEMANIHEIEKEIIQLQENIEAALNELQTKPRGIMAKYAKLTKFEDGRSMRCFTWFFFSRFNF